MSNMQRRVMRLPATLDLAAADKLHRDILAALDSGGSLVMEASAVEVLTLPCAQVIFATLQTYTDATIARPSPEFVSAFEDLALDWRETDDVSDLADNPVASEIQRILVDGSAENVGEAGPSEMSARAAKRILTIDDSKTMRDMLMMTLADAGFDVLQGVDGQDGLDVLGDSPVDVVITDINMPRMDGYEVIRRLRDNPVHKSTPILVLTTESDTEKRALARSAGATGWMVKPFDPERLLATVRKVSP